MVAMAIVSFAAGAAVVPNRIAGAINNAQRAEVPAGLGSGAAIASDQGSADGNTLLPNLTIHFSQTAAQQADLTQLLADQQNPASSSYHHWLTPATFGARFGLSDADVAIVQAWLTAQGFTITTVGKARNFIAFSGTVAQAQRAFGAQIHRVQANGEPHLANMSSISVPAVLASVVSQVRGLDDLRPVAHARPIASPSYTAVSGNHYLVPGDYQTIYDVKPTLTSGTDGTGVTLVVIGQTAVDLSQIATFRSISGLPARTVSVQTYGTPGTNSNDAFESYLDLEWVGANAPGANIVFAISNSAFQSLQSAVDNNLGAIISSSYGTCEANIKLADAQYFDTVGQEANSFGITVLSATGDSGATDCEVHGTANVATAKSGLSIDVPASAPHVTAVGGTSFVEGSNPSTYWSPTTLPNYYQSALSYIPETAWNETSAASGLSSTGGGVSSFYPKPVWQTGNGVPADNLRHIPDVALTSAAHDAYLVCAPGYCATGFASTSGAITGAAGTSASTPAFAGMLALVIQKTGARIGNANPYLYALFNSTYSANVFHDVTTGNNQIPCASPQVTGSTCIAGTTVGYSANVGYDQTTGLGSVDATNMVNYWKLATPVGLNGTTASTSTLTLSSATGTVGGTDMFNAVVAPSAATGNVFYVVNGVSYDYETLTNGSKSVTLTLDPNYFKVGTNTVQVRYLGDSTYAPSVSNTVTLTLTAGTTSTSFTISPQNTTVTVAHGATATPVVFTVKGLGGYTGTVTMSASTTSSTLAACYTFAPSSVALSTTATSATTSFTIVASTPCATTSATQVAAFAPAKVATSSHKTALRSVAGGGLALAALMLFVLPRRRRWAPLLLVLLAIAGAGLSGCGSGSNQTTVNTGTTTNTTPGTYQIVIQGSGPVSGGTTTSTASVTLIVT